MDREKAKKLLELYGNPTVNFGKTTLVFARQSLQDVQEIEKMTNSQLIKEWKELCVINQFIGQVSMSELQRISLLELEMSCREKIDKAKLTKWYERKSKKKREC